MTNEEIRIGMKLRVREWDDMLNEFGLHRDYDDIIETKDYIFLDAMRHLCGKEFTVISTEQEDTRLYYRSKENIEDLGTYSEHYWYIAASMLEPADRAKNAQKITVISQEDFFDLIR